MLVFLVLRIRRLNFSEQETGGGVSGGSIPWAIALLACMQAAQEEERAKLVTFLRFRRSNFPKRGAGGRFLGRTLPSAAARLICMLKHPRQRGGLGILEIII